jgi:hypothetical protein
MYVSNCAMDYALDGTQELLICSLTMIRCQRQRWLANQLPSSAGNARAVRLFGTELLSVRIDLDG